MITKDKNQIKALREGGHLLAQILREVAKKAVAGAKAKDLDIYAQKLIKEAGALPAFLNYQSKHDTIPFPAALCVSINDEVVHGLPGNKILKEGDIVSLDLGIKYKGFFTDHAVTVPVGSISKTDMELLKDTKKSLDIGIKAAKAGNTTGDIGYAIEKFLSKRNKKYGIIRVLAGHGVGLAVHEDPFVPNYGRPHEGVKLVEGMVLALEPMVNLGTDKVFVDKDGWTFKTEDGKRGAHFEHTILVTAKGAEILTA